MNWVPAALMAMAVFVVMRPNPAQRLEAILGSSDSAEREDPWRRMIGRYLHGSRERRAARKAAIDALAALAAELSAGTPQQHALVLVGEHVWPAACGAVRFDGDVAEALRLDAQAVPLLAPLAACWAVSAQQGSGLSTAVARLAEQARIAEDVRVQLEAELAGPRATARILVVLPLFGIAMGIMMGVNPFGWLLGTWPGLACLLMGLCLIGMGYWWTSRIVARVERLL